MSVRILSLSLEGFRAIREPFQADLLDPHGRALGRVVIGGPNGSGKTSILEGILLALGREELIVRDLPATERGDHWRTQLPPGAKIVVECSRTGFQPALFEPGHRFTVTRTVDHWSLSGTSDLTNKTYTETDEATIRGFLQALSIEYFSSWRAPTLPGGLQPTTRGPQPSDNESNRLRRLKQRIINERARAAFQRQDQSPGADERWLSRINDVWAAFHTDGSTIDADVVDPSTDDPSFDLFVFDGERRRCSIDQVSSGELELLTIAGTLILAEFDGLLLIDEPELHLHREWQTQLLDTLRAAAPNAQLVVATHADPPWDQVYSFERIFLAPVGDPRGARPRLAVAQDD